MSRTSVSRLSDETGSVLIEFALVLPMLLLIVVGIFDFGFAFQKYEVLTNAAREGARMAVLTGYSTPDVKNRVAAYLTAAGATDAPETTVDDETITPGPPSTGPAFRVKKVTVTLPHTFVYLGPLARVFGGTFGTIQLKAISVMRSEVGGGG
jgi:TadE-like protein